MTLETLGKVAEAAAAIKVRGQEQTENLLGTLDWIDHRCQEAVGAYYSGKLDAGQAVTVLQDIHATIVQIKDKTK